MIFTRVSGGSIDLDSPRRDRPLVLLVRIRKKIPYLHYILSIILANVGRISSPHKSSEIIMNAVWQVQEAKNRFSELVERAVSDRPQTVTRHGRAIVRVVAIASDEDAMKQTDDDGFVQYLLNSPKVDGFELPVRRSRKAPPPLSR